MASLAKVATSRVSKHPIWGIGTRSTCVHYWQLVKAARVMTMHSEAVRWLQVAVKWLEGMRMH